MLLRALGLAGGLFVVSCVQDSTGPNEARLGRLAIAPVFDMRALMLVDFDRVRVRLVRPGTNQVVIDTVVVFPAGADSVILSLPVPVQGSSETFSLTLAMVNAVGDTVFRGGPVNVTAAPGVLNTAPAQPTIRYTGTGSNAASVRFVTAPSSAFFADTVLYDAEALDSAGAVIPNTPIVFSVSDTSRASVPNPAVGRVVAKTVRGTVEVRASLLTPPTAATTLTVQPRPSALAVLTGSSGQTGTVGAALAQPITAVVTATDGLGVQGVTVSFAVASGGGTLSAASAVTDSAGKASVTWTMGTAAGAASATASATGLTPASVSFTATAAPGAAKTLVYTLAPPSSVAADALFDATVAARDTFGNTATAFTGTVSLAFGVNPGAATLVGTTSVAAVAGVATFTGLRVNVATSGYTLVASSAGLTSVTSSPITVTAGAPVHLTFTTPPSNVVAGAVMAPAVVVAITDAAGNRVPTATDSVTLAIAAGPTGATLGGTTKVAAVAGQATFSDLTLPKAGANYRLVPMAASMARDTSAAFTVAPASPAVLAFTQEPTNAAAGAAIAPDVQVAVRDTLGNVVASYTDTMTLTLSASPTGDTLRGVRKVAASAGVATFGGLSLVRAGAGYRLGAAAAGVTGTATSGTFDIAPAAPARLDFSVEPSLVNVGDTIRPSPVVVASDAFGNLVPSFTGSVTVALLANPGGATLSGLQAVAAVTGQATFADLTLDRPGVGYTLVSSASGLAPDTSVVFEVRANVPTQLVFVVQPSNATAGVAIAPAVQVALKDALGNTVTTATDSIAVAIGSNPGSGTLSGTRKVAPVSGVATFADLSIDKSGVGYTLAASAGGLPVAASTTFDVAPGAAETLVFTTQPPTSVQAGQALSLVVTAKDAQGNTVMAFADTVKLALGTNPQNDTLQGTLSAVAVNGVASFSTPYLRRVTGGIVLTASATGLASGNSSAFSVTEGPAAALVFQSTPSLTSSAGSPFGTIIAVKDAFGNYALSYSGSVTIALASAPAGGALSGTLTVPVSSALATFTDLSIDKVGLDYQLQGTSGALTSPLSPGFEILPGAASALVFTAEPADSVAAGAVIPVALRLRDAYDNTVTGHTDPVTLAVGTNPSGDTLQGTVSVVPAAGVATFSTPYLRRAAAGYTLSATSASLTAASRSFKVTPAVAATLSFATQPLPSLAAGSAMSVTVVAKDAFGNVATGFTGNVTLDLGTNPSGGTLTGTLTSAAVAGVASFTTPSVDLVGLGYALRAASGALPSVSSTAFDVVPGAATQLVFTTSPAASVTAGTALGAVVTVKDAQGNTVPTYGGTVTLALGANPTSDTLQMSVNIALANGTTSFPDAYLRRAGTGYTVTATVAGLPTATSGAFDVVGGLATQLVFTQPPPPTATAGVAFQIVAGGRDAFGNSAALTDTVRLALGVNPGSDALQGTLTAMPSAGVATFSTPYLRKAATGYTVLLSGTGLGGAESPAFAVQAGPPALLTFSTQPPTSVQAGQAFTTVVSAEDAYGNATALANGTAVTLALGANPGGDALQGTTSVAASGGVATFATPYLRFVQSGYTLVATAAGVASSGPSSAIAITVAPASTLALVSGSSQIDTVSSGLTDSLVVRVTDAWGNPVPGTTVSWGASAGTLSGTTAISNATGLAFVRWTLGAAFGRQTTTASVTGLSGSPFTFQALAQSATTTHR